MIRKRGFVNELATNWITEIAERIGYTNASYFHRMFKKHFGMTPADYRRMSEGHV